MSVCTPSAAAADRTSATTRACSASSALVEKSSEVLVTNELRGLEAARVTGGKEVGVDEQRVDRSVLRADVGRRINCLRTDPSVIRRGAVASEPARWVSTRRASIARRYASGVVRQPLAKRGQHCVAEHSPFGRETRQECDAREMRSGYPVLEWQVIDLSEGLVVAYQHGASALSVRGNQHVQRCQVLALRRQRCPRRPIAGRRLAVPGQDVDTAQKLLNRVMKSSGCRASRETKQQLALGDS